MVDKATREYFLNKEQYLKNKYKPASRMYTGKLRSHKKSCLESRSWVKKKKKLIEKNVYQIIDCPISDLIPVLQNEYQPFNIFIIFARNKE